MDRVPLFANHAADVTLFAGQTSSLLSSNARPPIEAPNDPEGVSPLQPLLNEWKASDDPSLIEGYPISKDEWEKIPVQVQTMLREIAEGRKYDDDFELYWTVKMLLIFVGCFILFFIFLFGAVFGADTALNLLGDIIAGSWVGTLIFLAPILSTLLGFVSGVKMAGEGSTIPSFFL